MHPERSASSRRGSVSSLIAVTGRWSRGHADSQCSSRDMLIPRTRGKKSPVLVAVSDTHGHTDHQAMGGFRGLAGSRVQCSSRCKPPVVTLLIARRVGFEVSWAAEVGARRGAGLSRALCSSWSQAIAQYPLLILQIRTGPYAACCLFSFVVLC